MPLNFARRMLLGLCLLALSESLASAQATSDKKLLPPKDMTLDTKDGVMLRVTYYAGTNDKDSVPVILLHEYNSSRRDLDSLALYLQKTHGCAVLCPDLRGHGESTTVKGSTKRLDLMRFLPADYEKMITNDMEAVKKFLREENNAGQCNLDKLSVVGIQMGATIGTVWSAIDYTFPTLATGKQGKDVKAVVMISPQYSFKGLPIDKAFSVQEFRETAGILLTCGEDDPKSKADAERIFKQFTGGRKQPDDIKEQRFFLVPKDTKLQATKLLTEPSAKLEEVIGAFLKLRAIDLPNPWQNRPSAL